MAGWDDILREFNETMSQSDFVRRKYLRKLSEYTGRNTIAYYSAFLNKPNASNLDINDLDLNELIEAVKRCMSYKLEITDYMDVIAVWYRDVLIYKATRNVDRVVFSDQLKYIKERASKSSYEGIEIILDALEKAKSRLKANVNFELTMELLLLTIKEN